MYTWREKIRSMVGIYRALSASYPTQMQVVRFVISGGTATAVNLGTLFALVHFWGIWYLLSSIFAFAASFFVSFTLQKLWTFEDTSSDRLHTQAVLFFMVITLALGINTTLLYVLVEYVHLHYLVAQFASGLVIAVMNFLSYKRLVFPRTEDTINDGGISASWRVTGFSLLYAFLLVVVVGILVLFSTYRLSENPPTWADEGIISQVAINLAHSGIYGVQTAPGHFVSADFVTTSFPVVYPIALSFFIFGSTLLNARVVMVLFVALLCLFSYLLIRGVARERKYALSLFSLYLLVTFAPLYGHGKNVLGEVPGLMFFIASLLFFHKAERSSSVWLWVFSGLLVGLSMATKPLYLMLILPSMLLVVFIQRKHLSWPGVFAYIGAACSILLLWFFIQYASLETLKEIVFASNPNNVPISHLIFGNVRRFVSEAQPIYLLALLVLWCGTLLYRRWRVVEISSVELFAAIFSAINFILFLASRGFYRYFFPAEVVALIFLPLALFQTPIKSAYRNTFLKACAAFIILLILFQGYQALFRSWVSEYRSSDRSALLAEQLRRIPQNKTVFLYGVPEAAIFLTHQPYYQYLPLGDTIIRGAEYLPLLFHGDPDFVLVDRKFDNAEKIAPLYTEFSRFDKYTLYERAARK